jgi:hypothetical protein
LTELDGDADDDAETEVELELLEEEQAAAASPVRARTGIATSFRLSFISILLFRFIS